MLIEKLAQDCFTFFALVVPFLAYNSCGVARSEHSTKPRILPANVIHFMRSNHLGSSRFFYMQKKSWEWKLGTRLTDTCTCMQKTVAGAHEPPKTAHALLAVAIQKSNGAGWGGDTGIIFATQPITRIELN